MGAALRHPPPPEDRQGGTPGGSLLMPPPCLPPASLSTGRIPFPQSSVPCDVTGRNFITPPGDETHPLNTSALLRCQLALVTIVRAWPSAAVSQARVQSSPLQTKYPPAKKASRFLTEKTETESGWLRGGLNPWTFTQNYKLLLFS